MTGKPTFSFEDDDRWKADAMGVEFTILGNDGVNSGSIKCHISRECMDDLARSQGMSPSQYVQFCKREKRKRLHGAIDRKLKNGEFEREEPVRLLVIKSADILN